MKISLPTYQKIGIVYGILVVLLVIALTVRFISGERLKSTTGGGKTTTAVKKDNLTGKVSLVEDKTSYKVGEKIELSILYQATGKKLDGIDIVLRYDPQVVNALGFSESNSFKIYPRKDIDNKAGVVAITALDSASDEPLPLDKLLLGKLQLVAQKAGITSVDFDFTAGGTNKTAMIETGTSANIVGEAKGVTITVMP